MIHYKKRKIEQAVTLEKHIVQEIDILSKSKDECKSNLIAKCLRTFLRHKKVEGKKVEELKKEWWDTEVEMLSALTEYAEDHEFNWDEFFSILEKRKIEC